MFTLFRMKLNNKNEKNTKKSARIYKTGLTNSIGESINYSYLD